MSDRNIWITIVLLAVATIATRGIMFLLGRRVRLPERVQHALRYAPAAALAAIVVPDLVLAAGPSPGGLNIKLLAAIGAASFFLATRHLLGAIVAGMVCFTVLRLYL